MCLNPDPTAQNKQLIFTRKTRKIIHPKIFFSSIPVDPQKHLSIHLDPTLSFKIDIKTVLTKFTKLEVYYEKFINYHFQ